jgi:DNA-binding transcriptional LysR family regulator
VYKTVDIRQLKYFESIVRNKKFTKAAEELHISQPSLSNIIKSLEEELNCTLLERSTREIIPTTSGEVLYKHACKLLNNFNNIYKEMEDVKEFGELNLNIGMIESAKYWMPKVIRDYKNKYPYGTIKFLEMGAGYIEGALENYDLHVGITTNFTESEKFTLKTIYQEEFVLMVPINHKFSHMTNIDLRELRNEEIIQFPDRYRIKEQMLEACLQSGFEPRVSFEVERLETARSLVEEGLSVAIVPENYLKYSTLNNIKIVRLTNPTPQRNIYIIYLNKRYLPPSVHSLMSTINHFFGSDKFN